MRLDGRLVRWGLQLALALAVASCGHPHPVPADALIMDLQGGISTTLAAMGSPALPANALTDEATQLAWSTQPRRIDLVRSGTLSALSVAEQSRILQLRIAQGDTTAHPPQVLAYLISHVRTLDLQQRLLLEAVRAQCALELPPRP
jgi:hypothetical protein